MCLKVRTCNTAKHTATNAVPNLQLDAEAGSIYDNSSGVETTICSGNECDFYAIATPGQTDNPSGNPNDPPNGPLSVDNILTEQYYVSIAVTPALSDGDTTDYGSFTVTYNGTNGATPTTTIINVTEDMVFGVPPLEIATSGMTQGSDAGDLPTHGMFETYFTEIAIMFVTERQSNIYNVVDAAGTPEANIPGTGAYYEKLTIDRTLLAESLNLHLDLYNTDIHDCIKTNPGTGEESLENNCTIDDVDAGKFAPFSHDAETGSSTGSQASTGGGSSGNQASTGGGGVPEPSVLALLGFGMLGGLLFNRKRKIKG